jgi:hypothetical protein
MMANITVTISGLAAALFLLLACERHETAQQPKATASEIFHLRSECATLADKVAPANGDYGPYGVWQNTVSHYNPDTNRCYALGTVRYNSIDNVNRDFYTSSLFDAQTKEQLAFESWPAFQSTAKRMGLIVVYGIVKLSGLNPARSYEEADEYIGKIMEDDRSPKPGPKER